MGRRGRAIREDEATGLRMRDGASCPAFGKEGVQKPHTCPPTMFPHSPPTQHHHPSMAGELCGPGGDGGRAERMGKGSPREGGLGREAADLKAWRRWLDDKGDILVTESKLSSLGPQRRPAPLPLKCEREDREMGRGQRGPISPRGTTNYPGAAVVGRQQAPGHQRPRDPWLVTHPMPLPSARAPLQSPRVGPGQADSPRCHEARETEARGGGVI